MPAVNPGDPRLIELLRQGATEAEFAGLAAEAVAKSKGFAWVLTVLQSRRAEAAAISLAPPAQAAANGHAAADATKAYLAREAEHAAEVERQRLARRAAKGATA